MILTLSTIIVLNNYTSISLPLIFILIPLFVMTMAFEILIDILNMIVCLIYLLKVKKNQILTTN